jgi:hypothetical protein
MHDLFFALGDFALPILSGMFVLTFVCGYISRFETTKSFLGSASAGILAGASAGFLAGIPGYVFLGSIVGSLSGILPTMLFKNQPQSALLSVITGVFAGSIGGFLTARYGPGSWEALEWLVACGFFIILEWFAYLVLKEI